MTQLRTIIQGLEKHERELQIIINTLRVIDVTAPIELKGPASLDSLLEEFETSVIAGALRKTNGNQQAVLIFSKSGGTSSATK